MSRAAKEKLCLQAKFYASIIEELQKDPEAFIKVQAAWIGENYNPSQYLESQKEKIEKIVEFLENMAGKALDKKAQNEFREKFEKLALEYGEKLTDREERLAGKAKINSFCKKLRLPFKIEAIRNSKFWIIKGEANDEEKMLYN